MIRPMRARGLATLSFVVLLSALAGSVLAVALPLRISHALPRPAAVDGSSGDGVRRGGPCRAAVALRDRVPRFEQVGTHVFTEPLLAERYDAWAYITADDRDDGHARVVAALSAAQRAGCSVDLFLLDLGRSYVPWVERMPPDERPALHLVYDTGGDGARYGPRWLALGAEMFVGHGGPNVAPVFYAFFLPKLVQGVDVDDAVTAANRATRDVLDGTGGLFAWGMGMGREALWRSTEARVFRAADLR